MGDGVFSYLRLDMVVDSRSTNLGKVAPILDICTSIFVTFFDLVWVPEI